MLANESADVLQLPGFTSSSKSIDLLFKGIDDTINVLVGEEEADANADSTSSANLVATSFFSFIQGEALSTEEIAQASLAFKQTLPQRFIAYEPFMQLCEISSHVRGPDFLNLVSENLDAGELSVLADFQQALRTNPKPPRADPNFEKWYNHFDILTDEWALTLKKDRIGSPKPKF